MGNSLKKRGQKFVRKFSRFSMKASEDSKEHIKENLVERISHIQDIKLLILEWSLLVLALITLSVTQAFWSSNSYAENVFVDGGSYTEATLGKINSMNPLFATTNSEKVLSKLMFATLTAVDYSGHSGPQLADSLIASENGKVWTMHLREGLHWSDGEPITNEDVLFTISLIQNPAVGSIYTANLTGVKVSEDENGNIVFALPSAYADFTSALEIPLVPKHILEDASPKTLVEHSFSNSPVTSGAFAFNATQIGVLDDENTIYLSANPYYYLGRPMLNSFSIHAFSTKEKIINAVNSGSVTATAELSGEDAEKITSGQFQKKTSEINYGSFIFFNMSNNWLKNRDLRRAIREGIDIGKIRSAAPDTAALDFPIIDSQIKLSNLPDSPVYNLEAAKNEISTISGGEPIKLSITTVNSGYLPKVANVLAEELRNLGIEVTVVTFDENKDFITNVIARRNYEILLYDVELGADPDPLAYYHSSQATASGLNLSNYRSGVVDDLLVGARETIDEQLRTKKYESFLNHWTYDTPAIGLYQSNLTYIYNKNVRPYSNNVRLVDAIDRFSDICGWASNKDTKNRTP